MKQKTQAQIEAEEELEQQKTEEEYFKQYPKRNKDYDPTPF